MWQLYPRGEKGASGSGHHDEPEQAYSAGTAVQPRAPRESSCTATRGCTWRGRSSYSGARGGGGGGGADYKSRHASGGGGPAQEPGPGTSQAQACAVVLGSGGAGPPRLSAGARGVRAAVVAAIGGEAGGAGPPRTAVGKAVRAEAGRLPAGEARVGLLRSILAMAAAPLKVCIVGSGNW